MNELIVHLKNLSIEYQNNNYNNEEEHNRGKGTN